MTVGKISWRAQRGKKKKKCIGGKLDFFLVEFKILIEKLNEKPNILFLFFIYNLNC